MAIVPLSAEQQRARTRTAARTAPERLSSLTEYQRQAALGTQRTVTEAAARLSTIPGYEQQATSLATIAPTIAPEITYTTVTKYVTVPPDTENYVQLSSDEWVSKEAYNALSAEDQQRLQELGVDGFNAYYQQKAAEFEGTHVKLPSGEWVEKSAYDELTSEQQQKLQELGIEGFNTYYEGQVAAFQAAHIQLPNGEWISKTDYDALTPQQQQQLTQLGITAFNEQVQQTVSQYNSDVAVMEPYRKADGTYDVYKAIQGGVSSDILTRLYGTKAIADAQEFLASHMEVNLAYGGGEWITNEQWTELEARYPTVPMTPNVKYILLYNGIDAFNSWLASGGFPSLNLTASQVFGIPQQPGATLQPYVDDFGTVHAMEIPTEAGHMTILAGGVLMPSSQYQSLPIVEQKIAAMQGMDALYLSRVQKTGLEAQVQQYQIALSEYNAELERWESSSRTDLGWATELNTRAQQLQSQHNVLQQQQQEIDRIIGKVSGDTKYFGTNEETGETYYNLVAIMEDKVLSPGEMMTAFGQTPEGRENLQAAIEYWRVEGEKRIHEEYGGTPAKAEGIARTYLDWTVPGYATVRHWDDMSSVWKGISIAGDIVFFLPMIGGVGKAGSVAREAANAARLAGEGIREVSLAGRVANVTKSGLVLGEGAAEGGLKFFKAVATAPFKAVFTPVRSTREGLSGGKKLLEMAIFPIRHPVDTAKGWSYVLRGDEPLGRPLLSKLVSLSEVKVPVQEGETVVWKGLQLAERPIAGKSGDNIVFGGRKITRPQVGDVATGYEPVTALETRVMLGDLKGNTETMRQMGFTSEEIDKIRATLATRSRFAEKTSPYITQKMTNATIKTLSEEGVASVLTDVAKQGSKVERVYGSVTIREQLKPEYRLWREPADIDIQTRMAQADTEKYVQRLAGVLATTEGRTNVRVSLESPTLIETRDPTTGQWHHAVDVHSYTSGMGQVVPEGAYGMPHAESAVEIAYPGKGTLRTIRYWTGLGDELPFMSLSESGKRKAASILEWRGGQVAPPEHRVKDIADYYIILATFEGESAANQWARTFGFDPAELKVLGQQGTWQWEWVPSRSVPGDSVRISIAAPSWLSSPSETASILSPYMISPSLGMEQAYTSTSVPSVSPARSMAISPSVSLVSPVSPSAAISHSLAESAPSPSVSKPVSPYSASVPSPVASSPYMAESPSVSPYASSPYSPSPYSPSVSSPSPSPSVSSPYFPSPPPSSYPPSEVPRTPKIPPPILLAAEGDEKKAREMLEVSVTWRQGMFWVIRFPPYRKQDIAWEKQVPEGVTIIDGPGSAYATLQKLNPGAVPDVLEPISMGFEEVGVTEGGQRLEYQPVPSKMKLRKKRKYTKRSSYWQKKKKKESPPVLAGSFA